MVKHIILWKFKDMDNPMEKKKLIKDNLEGLDGKIPGMKSIHVTIKPVGISNSDAMLEVVFENEEALLGYKDNPLHVNVAETYIRPYIDTRLCFDFEI